MSDVKMKIAYVITKNGDKSYWNRIGVAFVNNDGSINVKLDAYPVNGELQLRDREDNDSEGSERSGGGNRGNDRNNDRNPGGPRSGGGSRR